MTTIQRKLYIFRCRACGKSRRQTFKKSKATIELCRKCRKDALEAARGPQSSLFEVKTLSLPKGLWLPGAVSEVNVKPTDFEDLGGSNRVVPQNDS